jgi:LysR family transcriptional regulator, hydrogen peroxide-inducible genes activator
MILSMSITLKQLRYFAAVARTRHFGRAAEECHVSQPALSVQVQDLEALLGTPLLERRRGGIALTPMGLEVERRARSILSDAGDLVDYVRHGHKLLTGTLRLGVIPSVAPYLLPAVLPRVQGCYPDLDLRLREAQTATLLQELEDGSLDVLLLSLPVGRPRLEVLRLFDDRFLLVTAASRAGDILPQRPEDLADSLLLLEEGHCMRDQALTYCRLASQSARRQYGTSSLATIVQMVANGYGSTLLPEIAVPVEVRGNPAVRVTRFSAPEPMRTLGLAWRGSSARKADFVALGQVVEEAARPLVQLSS